MARNGVGDALPHAALAPLDTILRTDDLRRRPWREPDYETENRALAALVQALADSPRTILQTLADTVLDVCHADSAGMSLLTDDAKSFEWAAIAGAWKPHLGGGTPRDFGPCGDVLDRNQALLFTHWERRYPYLSAAIPLAEEGLLVPFYVGGKAVGTIWAITHGTARKFDSEDLRALESLGRFASAAYQTARLRDADEARRAALNVMKDAIEAREAVARLNTRLSASEQKERAQKQILEMVATGKPLDEILDTLMLLIEGQEPGMRCGILLITDDGAYFRRGSGPHLPEAYHKALDGVRVTPPYFGSCGEAAHRCAAVLVPDIASETRYADEWRAMMSSCGIRAGRSTPVCGPDGRVLGSLAMYFDSPRDPNPADPALVHMAANLAAIAIERDHAEKSVRQQLQEMQRLHAFSRTLLMHDDVEAMMREVLSAVAELMHIDKANVQLCDGRNSPLRLVGALGFDRAFNEKFQSVSADGFTTCAAALRRRDRIIVEDLQAAPEFAQLAQLAAPYGIKAVQSTPLRNRQGAVVAMLTTYFDRPYRPTERELQLLDVYAELAARQIERKRHLEHREMLMNELNHRVKNTLATVQSIAAQTLRRAASPAEARNAIESRLVALSKAHNVLTREHWEGADIQELVADALAAYFSGDHARRLEVAGGPIKLTPKAALTLSMALHELATNAMKYGALSNDAGHVRIEWNVVRDGKPAFRLRWSESNGPPVSPPRRRGFGSRLIEQGLAHDLAGEVRLDFRQQGLVCTIEAPLGEVAGGG